MGAHHLVLGAEIGWNRLGRRDPCDADYATRPLLPLALLPQRIPVWQMDFNKTPLQIPQDSST